MWIFAEKIIKERRNDFECREFNQQNCHNNDRS